MRWEDISRLLCSHEKLFWGNVKVLRANSKVFKYIYIFFPPSCPFRGSVEIAL